MRGGTIPVPTIPRRGIVAGVVSLLVGALVLVGAAGPASAAGATCVYNTTTLEVEISVSGGGSVSIGRTSAGNFYVEGAADPTCPSPGGSVPTRLNVTKVKVTAGSDSTVTIDQTNGRFEPGVPSESGGVSEIEFELTFAPSTLLGNLLEVIGTPGDDVIRADGTGINLNENVNDVNDSDNDITGTAGAAFSNVDQIDFFGGAGNDLLSGVGTIGATPTDNSIKMEIHGQAGGDTIEGGAHANDVVSYDTSPNPVDVDLGTNSATGDGADTIRFVEWVVGSAFDDVLKGDAADNRISPGSGDDRVLWSPGEDDLRGDGGTDVADFSGYTGDGPTKLHLDSPASAGNLAAKDGDTTIGGDPQRIRGSIENIIGTAVDDEIEGNDGPNVLWGLDGGDTLVGRDGSDRLLPGLGSNLLKGDSGTNTSGTSDTVDYSDYAGDGTTGVTANLDTGNACKGKVTDQVGSCSGGNDFIFSDVENLTGSPVDDVLTGSDGGNTITGLAGDDSLDGGSGDDTLVPGVGDDTVFGGGTLFGDTVDFSDAGSGVTVDLVAGTASSATDGNDTISVVQDVIGSPFADDILGDAGANTIVAGVGDDTVEGGAGDDTLQGGDGTDTLTFENAGSGATANLASQSGMSQNTGHGSDTITGFENLTGSNHNDTLTGDGNVNVIRGLDGNDTIKGGASNDLLEGGPGDDGLDGEGGTDTVTYANAPSGVIVNLSTTSAQPTRGAGSDTITNVENVTGSAFADTLQGNAAGNVLSGLAGNDTFLANSDADGNDIFLGGTGTDTVSYAARADGVKISIDGNPNDGTPATEDTAAETDNVETDIENVIGGAGHDTINGSGVANVLRGAGGNDTINGGNGDDTIDGGAGNDALRGDSGNDSLLGGSGNDRLLEGSAKNGSDRLDGGSGTDEVDYSARTNPVKVTWDNLANDGEEGEQDNVLLSVESALTASGRIDPTTSTEPPPPPAPGSQQGYTLVGTDGGIFNFGTSEFHGSAPGLGIQLNSPIIGMAHTPGGGGYWQVAGDGGIFTFGDALFHGSMGGEDLNSPVLGMAATPSGNGYWLYAADGGIFSFGDAAFYGSMGDQALNKPVVSMTPTSDGKGYWLVASDGGIFSFGSATFHGSTGDITLNSPIFGLAADPDGAGYWMVARDGGVFAFDAPYHGAGTGAVTKAIGLAASPSVSGYWIADDRGHVLRFGGAVFLGDLRNIDLNSPIVGFASVPPAAS